MLKSKNFSYKADLLEACYEYTINYGKYNEKVLVSKKHGEQQWIGMYKDVYGKLDILPVSKNADENKVLDEVCDWVNIVKRIDIN